MNSEQHLLNKHSIGKHRIIDLFGCDISKLNFSMPINSFLQAAISECGGIVVASRDHQFKPFGATAVILIEESHVSVHTWPEQGKALVDIFASGGLDIDRLTNKIYGFFGAQSKKIIDIDRG